MARRKARQTSAHVQGVYSKIPLPKGTYMDGERREMALCMAWMGHMSKLDNYSKILQSFLQYYAFHNDVKL